VWNRAFWVRRSYLGYLVNIMRMVLSTVLMMAATKAWADEPSTPEAKSETAAEAAADQPAAPAHANSTEATATTTEATAKAAVEEEKPFKPPSGYRAKRVNGMEVYCTKVVVLGSRFPKEDCRTEAQLRDLEAQKGSMRGEMDQKKMICSGAGACGGD
jgi:hypothetical protein